MLIRGRTNYHFAIFLSKKINKKKEKTQRNIAFFLRTNKQEKHFFFLGDRANGNNSKNMASCEQGEYVKGEIKKEKKRKTMIKPNRVFKKKRYIKKEGDRGKNNEERELKKKNVQKHLRLKRKKRNFEKNNQTCKDK